MVLEPIEQGQSRAQSKIAGLDGVRGELVGEGVNGLANVHAKAGGGIEVGQECAFGRQRGNFASSKAEFSLLQLKVVLEGMPKAFFEGPCAGGHILG